MLFSPINSDICEKDRHLTFPVCVPSLKAYTQFIVWWSQAGQNLISETVGLFNANLDWCKLSNNYTKEQTNMVPTVQYIMLRKKIIWCALVKLIITIIDNIIYFSQLYIFQLSQQFILILGKYFIIKILSK